MSDTPDLTKERLERLLLQLEGAEGFDKHWQTSKEMRDVLPALSAALATERARADKAEAERDALAGKMAKAVKALRRIVAVPSSMADADEMERIARATLAEITGGGNE